MTLATLSGYTVTRASVQVPSWGVWWADVELAGEVTLTGSVTLTIADLDMVGTIKSGGAANGRSGYRIAGGAGGWGTSIGPWAYVNDAGVKKSSIASDAATASGETVVTTGLSGKVGPHYVRETGVASYALDHVSPRAWYVAANGVTYFGTRTSTAVTTDAPRVRVDPGAGVIVLAPTSISALVPGAVVDSLTAVDVRYDVSPEDGLRVTLVGSRFGLSKRLESLRRIVRSLLPEYRWHGVYEYRIVIQVGERLEIQPVLTSLGLPVVSRVRVRPGMAGLSADHAVGSLVLVTFVNGDPARPVVTGFDDAESTRFLPDDIVIEANNTVGLGPTPRKDVARKDDIVVVGGFGGTITQVFATGVEVG
jgi:hypothetical protein